MIESISAPAVGARRSQPATTVWFCLFVVVSVAAIALRLSHRQVAWRTPDERVYMNFATEIAHSGINGFRTLMVSYNQDKQQWGIPPPTRIGYIGLVAGVMKLSGASAEQAAVSVSGAFSVLAFFIVALLGLRFFDRWAVLIGLALLSVSPLDLAISRRAWQDSVWGCVGLFLFYLCMEASTRSRPKLWRICFWVVAACFLLIKESALVVFGLCTLWLVGSAWVKERSLQKCLHLTIMSALVAAVSFAVLSCCFGGAFAVFEIIQHCMQSWEWNQYGHQFQRGPWHSFFTGFWVMSPITTLLGLAGVATIVGPRNPRLGLLARDQQQRQIGWAIVYLIFALTFVVTVLPDLKNLRYVTILFGPWSLLSGLGIMHLLALAKSNLAILGYRFTIGLVVIVLGLTCLMDYRRFERVFVRYALDDLALSRVINHTLAAGSNADAAPVEVAAPVTVSGVGPSLSPPRASAEDYLFLSKKLYDQGLYGKSIQAAEEAVKLKPAYAEAYNNIGAAYASMGKWDDAIKASREALRLKPDFPLARNNLAWAETEKRRTK